MHDQYAVSAINANDIDGYGFEFADWRFNVRMSNTEVIALLPTKTAEVLEIFEA